MSLINEWNVTGNSIFRSAHIHFYIKLKFICHFAFRFIGGTSSKVIKISLFTNLCNLRFHPNDLHSYFRLYMPKTQQCNLHLYKKAYLMNSVRLIWKENDMIILKTVFKRSKLIYNFLLYTSPNLSMNYLNRLSLRHFGLHNHQRHHRPLLRLNKYCLHTQIHPSDRYGLRNIIYGSFYIFCVESLFF